MITKGMLEQIYARRGVLAGLPLPNLVMDADTVVDTMDTVAEWWRAEDPSGQITMEHHVHRGPITREKLLSGTGVHDLNSLYVSVVMASDGVETRAFRMQARDAYLTVQSPNRENDERRIADYIVKNSPAYPIWVRHDHLLMVVPIALVLVGYVGLVFTQSLPGWAHLMLVGGLGGLIALAVLWMRKRRQDTLYRTGRITFLGQSRAKTIADRKQQRLNVKVIAITAPISLLIGVAGTLIATWLVP